MTLDELTEQLNHLAWREQIDFEASERGAASEQPEIEAAVRALARSLPVELVDDLEREGSHPTWVLRLSPHVPGDDTRARASRLAHHPSYEVRYLANALLDRS
jgi:hypothetical protein